MKKLWIGIGLVVVVALAIWLVLIQTKREPGEIKIGAVLPLTGNNAVDGEAAKQAIDLALEEKAKDLKQKGLNVKVVYEDDKMDPKEGVNAAKKLINIDKGDPHARFLTPPQRDIWNDFVSRHTNDADTEIYWVTKTYFNQNKPINVPYSDFAVIRRRFSRNLTLFAKFRDTGGTEKAIMRSGSLNRDLTSEGRNFVIDLIDKGIAQPARIIK